MCIQDIRIAAATINDKVVTSPAAGTITQIFKADRARYRLIIMGRGFVFPTVADAAPSEIAIFADKQSTQPLAVLTGGMPMVVLKFEDYGTLITDDIWVVCNTNPTPSIMAQSIRWQHNPEEAKEESVGSNSLR